jgi:hypothetical protein
MIILALVLDVVDVIGVMVLHKETAILISIALDQAMALAILNVMDQIIQNVRNIAKRIVLPPRTALE